MELSFGLGVELFCYFVSFAPLYITDSGARSARSKDSTYNSGNATS